MNLTKSTLSQFRKEKKKEVNPHLETLKSIRNEITDFYKQLNTIISEWASTDDVPYKVAEIILRDQLNQMNALTLTHKAMYKINNINTKTNLNILPEMEVLQSEANILFDSIKTELLNDPVFHRVTSSNAEREREISYILMFHKQEMDRIGLRYNQAKKLVKFMESASGYINRLDSMIRLKQNIIQSSEFESMVANGQKAIESFTI
jgi:hypothetical protein